MHRTYPLHKSLSLIKVRLKLTVIHIYPRIRILHEFLLVLLQNLEQVSQLPNVNILYHKGHKISIINYDLYDILRKKSMTYWEEVYDLLPQKSLINKAF